MRLYRSHVLRQPRIGRATFVRPAAHPSMRYELVPGATGRVGGVDATINAQGYRGSEGRPGKSPGYRIILLGDSVTFGMGLPLEDTFAFQLQQLLRQESQNMEVLNFGVIGYDIIQEVAHLEVQGLAYFPNLVVVSYVLNDAGLATINWEHFARGRAWLTRVLLHFELVWFVVARLERWQQAQWLRRQNDPDVFRREYTGQIDPIRTDEHALRALMQRVPDLYPSHWYGDPARIGRIRYAFRHLRAHAQTQGFSVLVLLIPRLTGDIETYPHQTAHRIVAMEAQRAGFDYLDLTAAFMSAGMENLKLRARDVVHPNRVGHTIIAQALAGYIRTATKGTPRKP